MTLKSQTEIKFRVILRLSRAVISKTSEPNETPHHRRIHVQPSLVIAGADEAKHRLHPDR